MHRPAGAGATPDATDQHLSDRAPVPDRLPASDSSPDVPEPATALRGDRAKATFEEAYSPRHNSLNFIRLVLALAVIFSHSLTIGTFGSESILDKTTLGTVAVYGFFGISGFLIAGSASRNGTLRFAWQRFLRIFPGYWVCLVVTAFFFGTIVWYVSNPALAHHCGLSCYLTEPNGPVGYVVHNLWLQGNQSTIAHTLPLGLFRPVWNGSLWTLFFECLCYALMGLLAWVGLLRRRVLIAALAIAVWLTEIVVTSIPSMNQHFSPSENWDVMKFLTFIPIFLAGSLFYLYRDRVPDSGWLAAVSFALFLAGLVLPIGNDIAGFSLTSMDLCAVFLVYPLLWLGAHLPLSKVGARNDYSYGVYIYGYPVQQMLVIGGVAAWGYWPYTLLAVAAVTPCAVASWWVIEKHALKLKTAFGSRPGRARSGAHARGAHATPPVSARPEVLVGSQPHGGIGPAPEWEGPASIE